ncbi:MAG: glycosyltransferase, partial [Pseudomonadota bacterium]
MTTGPSIVLVISDLEYGGAQRQVIELANQLAVRGAPVALVSLTDVVPLSSRLDARVDFRVCAKRAKYDVSIAWRLARILRERLAEVAHGFLFDADVAVRLAGALARTPIVLGSERNSDYTLARPKRWVYRLTRGLRHGCVANSWAGARFNAALLGHPIEHYRVVYNAVDTERFAPRDPATAKRALGLDPERQYVGMVGSFKKQKNHQQMVRAAAALADRFPRHDFAIAGDVLEGGRRDSYAIKEEVIGGINEAGLQERFKLLGNVDAVEVFYNACAVTVLPSYYEGLP